ncbi:MAG: CoA ester lyase [Castellaniella sp.]|nr:MAG: CoA ester lyase [Castellaniella sp.]
MDASGILRTALFVPATRPERFPKAFASGADAVIVDLEDAVEPAAKDAARANLAQAAERHGDVPLLVRVNGAGTPWHVADLKACAALPGVNGIVLPKAESADQILEAGAAGQPVFPIVESARGVRDLAGLAGAHGVDRLVLGTLDLMLDLGVTPATAGADLLLGEVRCQVLVQSRACRLAPPLDGVHSDISDGVGLARAARLSCEMGFGGMLCIHPTQVGIVAGAFAPSSDELDWARRVIAQAEATGSSAFRLDSRMVDQPVIEWARRIIARANV